MIEHTVNYAGRRASDLRGTGRMPRSLVFLLGVAAAMTGQNAHAATADMAAPRADLVIQAQTEAFSMASRSGDRKTLDALLDPVVAFTNEDGSTPTRQEIVEGASPAPSGSSLTVTDFNVHLRGDVATATFVDVLLEDFHGIHLKTNYRSTEVWAKRGNRWKLFASQTTIVLHEPPAIWLPDDELEQYVGTYELAQDVKTAITREGDVLFASTNGGPRHRLSAEFHDVLFIAGMPSTRRYFQRNRNGRITGYIINVNGNDLLARKVV